MENRVTSGQQQREQNTPHIKQNPARDAIIIWSGFAISITVASGIFSAHYSTKISHRATTAENHSLESTRQRGIGCSTCIPQLEHRLQECLQTAPVAVPRREARAGAPVAA